MEQIKFLQFPESVEAFSIFRDSFALVTSWEFAEGDPFAESSALPRSAPPSFLKPHPQNLGAHSFPVSFHHECART